MMTPASKPLSLTLRGPKAPDRCQSCGISGELDPPEGKNFGLFTLEAWRECDHRDEPTPVVLILCKKCGKKLIDPHPLLYLDLPIFQPRPGSMPTCCTCMYREELRCTHPDSKANGGEGIILDFPSPISARFRHGSRSQRMTIYRGPVVCQERIEEKS